MDSVWIAMKRRDKNMNRKDEQKAKIQK